MWRQGPESGLPADADKPSQLYFAPDTGRWFIADDNLEWQRANLSPQGNWSNTFAYKKHDLVRYQDSEWRALRPNIGVTPVEGADWTLFLAKGEKGDTGSQGEPGADGKTVRSGSGAPSSALGVDGDFYLDNTAHAIYGPKTNSGWGSPTSLIGPQGPTGLTGAAGPVGADGKTVRSGSGPPSSTLGVDGDFYINTAANTIYGPKASGAWGSATSLIGPQGPAGASAPFTDTTALVKGSADATKLVRIEADGLTTGTTRVWTAPDRDLDLGVMEDDALRLSRTEVSISGTTTLTSTAFGKMHVLSGTSAEYTVTLPTASGNAGKVIPFRGAAGLTRVVTISPAGRYVMAYDVLYLMSDGTDWVDIGPKPQKSRGFQAKRTLNTTPTLANNTYNKISLEGENYDPYNWYDTTTFLHTPKLPGLWVYSCSLMLQAAGSGYLYIDKNNGGQRILVAYLSSTFAASGVGYVQMNGTTDTVQMTLYASPAATLGAASNEVSYLTGEYIGTI